MDLLDLLDCSSASDNDCASTAQGNADTVKRCSGASESTRSVDSTAPISAPLKKRRRGCISIITAGKASPSAFERSIPHRRGHWAGHIMVPVRCFSRGSIHHSVLTFQRQLEEHGYSGSVVEHEERHLSLSRCFSLQAGNVEPFAQKLTERLSKVRSTRLYIDRRGEMLVNDEKTRTFWGWKVQSNSVLRSIVSHVDDILRQYNQPPYYENPAFHISLCSFAGFVHPFHHHLEVDDESSIDSAEDEKERDDPDYEDEKDYVVVDRVHCKFGNLRTFQIRLQSE